MIMQKRIGNGAMGRLPCVVVVFPDHTRLIFFINEAGFK